MTLVSKKYVVMCVGYTHSGKTTFAKKIAKTVSNLVLIDTDEIASFVMERYPAAVLSLHNKQKRDFRNPNLKFLLWKGVLKFCLDAGVNVMLSNGNLGKDIRSLICRTAKANGYKVVTVYFNIPTETVASRIKSSKKSTKMFVHSKKWQVVLDKQKGYAELPPSKKDTTYFEIQKNADYGLVETGIVRLLCK